MAASTATGGSSWHNGHRKDPPMRTRPLTIALVAIPTLLIGGVAYAAAQSVDNTPDSQVIIPASSTTPSTVDDHGTDGVNSTTPATVDDHGNDDRNVGTTPSTVDDHGGNRGPGGDDDLAT